MKHAFAVCLLLAISTALGQSPTATFSIVINTPTTTVGRGQPILLKIVMTNTSPNEIHWGQLLSEKRVHFDVNIIDNDGHAVELSAFGRRMNGIPEGGGMVVGGSTLLATLAPGKSISEELLLNQEYEIKRAGTYRIQTERFDPLSKVTVKSNVIILTVQ